MESDATNVHKRKEQTVLFESILIDVQIKISRPQMYCIYSFLSELGLIVEVSYYIFLRQPIMIIFPRGSV